MFAMAKVDSFEKVPVEKHQMFLTGKALQMIDKNSLHVWKGKFVFVITRAVNSSATTDNRLVLVQSNQGVSLDYLQSSYFPLAIYAFVNKFVIQSRLSPGNSLRSEVAILKMILEYLEPQ